MSWAEGHDGDERTMSRTDVLRASPPMFESRVLDALSRVHPAVPVIIFVPVIVILAAWGLQTLSVLVAVALAAAGYALWTLFEYWLHRVVFHFEPEDGFGARMHWIIHGVHHDHPNDPMRLVMPPAVSIPLGAIVFGVLYLVLGAHYAAAAGAGFFTGYLVYDMTHYYLHHFRPQGWLGRMLRERHMRHHFQDDTQGFGISAPYWDEVFRTSPRDKRSSQ
jgi:dihydroceramide fatty acyl 2-hydroxylase